MWCISISLSNKYFLNVSCLVSLHREGEGEGEGGDGGGDGVGVGDGDGGEGEGEAEVQAWTQHSIQT